MATSGTNFVNYTSLGGDVPWSEPEPPRQLEFDNSGRTALYVPGFNGIDVDFQIEKDAGGIRFAHGANDWKQYTRLTVREISMLKLMNALTDKPKWNEKVFDEAIVEKWKSEALGMVLISEKSWEWCLKELRDKAETFEETGLVAAFDTGSGTIKSDILVTESLRHSLIDHVKPLLDVPEENKDWHPRSDDQVLNLVHPSLFPLVYGQTRVLDEGGQVGLENMLDSCGSGEIAPSQVLSYEGFDHHNVGSRFSTRFQWLPCEVEFQGSGNDVTITSYINNLHPTQHRGLYSVIEKLISLSIEPWNKVLVYRCENRTPLRIRTYGYQFEPDWPEQLVELKNTWRLSDEQKKPDKYAELLHLTREYLGLPDHPDYEPEDSDDEEEAERSQAFQDGTWEADANIDYGLQEAIEWKWKRMREVKHPDAGESYSYEDWKAGKVDGSVVSPPSYGAATWASHKWYDVDLAKTWKEKGLQVIVKLSSIELTPEKPEYKGGNWHIEGMLNEHIVATSIYYYDVENTTESRISFRQEADLDDMNMNYEQSVHAPLCEIFGTDSLMDEAAVQDLGSITTPQGRLLAFPNTLQHKVEPFKLQDPTKPGHRRFIVLWLVDPHYRVVSTRNVPPQRHDWWAPDGYEKVPIDEKLPAELANMVHGEVGQWPMGLEEAKKLRLELMDERTNLMPFIESNFDEYNFCEH